MASTLASRALLGATLGLGAFDLVWLDLGLAPALVGATPVADVPARIVATGRAAAAPASPPAPAPAAAPTEPAEIAPRPRVESVYFASVSAEIAPAARDVLAGVASTAVRDIVLIGHSDHRGDPDLNQALRRRRALAVRDHLALLGISSDRVHVRTADAAAPTEEPELWRDRRVEIHFESVTTGGSR